MTLAEKPQFLTALVGMAEVYGRDLSPAALECYWLAVEPYPLAAVTPAFAAHLQDPDTGQFFPKPADLLRQLGGGPTKDLAALAWVKVERALRSVGAYQTVVFDDPIIMMALGDMGSWPALCHTLEAEIPFKAREFQQLYAAYLKRPKGDYPRSLPGLLDQTNAPQGFRLSPPVLLDDAQKALAVWHGGKDIATLAPPVRETAGLLALSQPAAPLAAASEAAEQDCQVVEASARPLPESESVLAPEEAAA